MHLCDGQLRRAETMARSAVKRMVPGERPLEIGYVGRFVLGPEHA